MSALPISAKRFEHLWDAVIARDLQMDGAFVYAVRSTGVYCRPSCPSRRPHRRQVVFFRTAREAQQRGFRACRRCWAQQATQAVESVAVARLCRILADGSRSRPGACGEAVRRIAAGAGIATDRLRRAFRRILAVTPGGYADQARLGRFKHQLRQEADVTTAIYESGYGSSSRLYERSNQRLGMTPATYGRGGRGMTINYTVSPSSIGRILVAATELGVSAVYLGRSDAELTATLRREYPEAQIRRNPERVSRWVRPIIRHLAGRQPQLDLPLDILGTAFQRRVWDALQDIPYGQTRSYTDVARQLGKPQARRAVARACATNPVCLVIPCHRVIRGDGGLGGYGGGVERKQKLLDIEKRASQKR